MSISVEWQWCRGVMSEVMVKNQKCRKSKLMSDISCAVHWWWQCRALRAQYVNCYTPCHNPKQSIPVFYVPKHCCRCCYTTNMESHLNSSKKQLCSGSSLLLGHTFKKTPRGGWVGGTTILRDAECGATVSDSGMSCYRTAILLQTKHILPQTTFPHSLTHSNFKDKLSHQR